MRKGNVSFTYSFENLAEDGGADIEATFYYYLSSWNESVPYGSTYASMPCGEAFCESIEVAGQSIEEADLIRITGGGFDPEKHWDKLDERAWEEFES